MRIAATIILLFGTAASALADTGPVRVIPGRPGVPVMINGRDASFGVVEGDWGLAKNIHVQPTVYGGWDRYIGPEVGHYYPSLGRKPGYGRVEIQPTANRVLPQPAESYHQSWGAQSAPPAPASQQHYDIPLYPPSVIESPRLPKPYRPNGFRPDLK